MDGFSKHNIDYLSASSINLWTNAPDIWVAKYLLKKHTPFGPAPKRGQAVERAVVATLQGKDMADAIKDAVSWFDTELFADHMPVDDERANIAPMTEVAVKELEEYGEPVFSDGTDQERISITANLGDFKIPVIGFLDLVFPEHGLVVDLKTTKRIPSVMSPDHQLQRIIYQRAKGNAAVKFLYVSAKKAAWLEDGDEMDLLPRLKAQIARLEAFLRANTAESAAATVPCNPNSFYWRDAEDMRREIYGL